MAAAFELERFAWTDGAFEVVGRWRSDTEKRLGRARLVVEVEGRRRRIGAHGGKVAVSGPDPQEWTARFGCARRPETVGPAELEVGDLIVDLPAPGLPPKEPELGPPPPDVRGAEALLEQLRHERAQTEAAARNLAEERQAAEEAARRLAEERAGAEAAAAAAHEAAERAARDVAEKAAKDAEQAARQTAEQTARGVAEEAARGVVEAESRKLAARMEREGPPTADHIPPPREQRPALPRREAIRGALERPREPKGVMPAADAGRQRELAYALAVLIVILIVVLLVLLL